MFATLLAWIRCTEIEYADVTETRILVQNALESLAFDDPRRPQVKAILNELWEGAIPVQAFWDLADQWEEDLEEQPAEVQKLEQEFRALAQSLTAAEWFSRSYGRLLKSLQQLDDGQSEPFYEYVESKRHLLEEAWNRYSQTPVLKGEVTAESVVGHRLLQNSIDAWLHSLDLLESAAESNASFNDGLAQAELGNRLLVAVDRLNDRTQALARTVSRR